MKHINKLLLAGIVLLLGSCSNDEIITEQPKEKAAAPRLIATVEQSPTTRAGVVEDNDYTAGEKFYWTNEDATTVFFKNSTMSTPEQYKKVEYSANVAAGAKSNSCVFNITEAESIANGEYTAYGFFPTPAWEMRRDYADFLTVNIPAYQTQNQPNSTHSGAYMLMKAKHFLTAACIAALGLTACTND